tara:strand:+ start:2045 stop:5563 length:3519 start_codon:yes stop_codon:yes gene_type:complete
MAENKNLLHGQRMGASRFSEDRKEKTQKALQQSQKDPESVLPANIEGTNVDDVVSAMDGADPLAPPEDKKGKKKRQKWKKKSKKSLKADKEKEKSIDEIEKEFELLEEDMKEDDSSARESQSAINFDEQCYLMAYWRDFVQHHKSISGCSMCKFFSGLPSFSPRNITLLDASYPEKVVGLFEGHSAGFDIFKKLTPAVQGLLVPKIRLFKVYPRNKQDKLSKPTDFVEFEIPFPQVERSSLEDLPSGGGIKSFSYKYLGGNPVTVDIFLQAELELYYANIDEFFKVREVTSPEGESREVRHSDIIIPQGKDPVNEKKRAGKENKTQVYDGRTRKENFIGGTLGNSFWTRAEIGWATPPKSALMEVLPGESPESIKQLIEQIKKTSTSLLLSYSKHVFDIGKDGSVKVKIEFTASLEQVFASSRFDLFNPTGEADEIEKEQALDAALKVRQKRLYTIIAKEIQSRIKNDNQDGEGCLKDRKKCGRPKRWVPAEIFGHAEDYDAKPMMNTDVRLFNTVFPKDQRRKGINISAAAWILDSEKVYHDTKDTMQTFELDEEGQERDLSAMELKISTAKEHRLSTDNLIKVRKGLAKILKIKVDDDAQIHEMRARVQMRKYRKILEKLYDDGKIHFVDLSLKDVDLWREKIGAISEMIERKRKERQKGKKAPETPKAAGQSTPPRVKKGKGKNKKLEDTSACRTMRNYSSQNKETRICNIKACLDSPQDSGDFALVSKQKSVNMRRINFVYFSDLIDTAVELLFKESPPNRDYMSRTRIILGNTILKDYRKDSQMAYSINLGDLPISLQDYMTWFQKMCTDKGSHMWTLRDFIRNCASDLLFAALGETCIRGVKQIGRPMMKHMSSYGIIGESGRKSPRDPIPRLPRVVLDDARLKQLRKAKPGQSVWSDPGAGSEDDEFLHKFPGLLARPNPPRIDMSHDSSRLKGKDIFYYLYLYGENEDIGGFTRQEKKDAEHGIFHFDMGVAGGFLKDIKFKKNTFEELRTKRIVDASEGSVDHIYDPYDADLTLYGNAYFKPGMYIYINEKLPNSWGRANAASQFAGKLGLGGYYFVLEVEHRIDSMKYETRLSAKYQSKVATSRRDQINRFLDPFHSNWDKKKIEAECTHFWANEGAQARKGIYNWVKYGDDVGPGFAHNSDIVPPGGHRMDDLWDPGSKKG